ncbi:MAG TPA: pyridoxal 5'-phosphate synthase glutaminase subunit PdxT, partial [Acidimicrobiales bacterium]|nr:pyridoxal 5'-phosphate synthase glutaminase subunit PdxT [Acidimicrobiales bacterium]
TIGVLALQGDFREHMEVLDHLGIAAVPVRLPADLARCDALIIPGGESTTISLLLRTSGVGPLLSERIAGDMPVMGTCAGMIVLAKEVLDGRDDQGSYGAIDISVRRNAFGRQRDSFEADLEIVGLQDTGAAECRVRAVFIRAPIVERTGPSVQILASVDIAGEVKPVVCSEGAVLVTSFHPELVGEARLHKLFLHTIAAHR